MTCNSSENPEYGLVSVVTTTHNCAGFIGETIESLQAQTYRDWELLVIDDCSADNTVEIIESYAKKDPRIHLVRLSIKGGRIFARNVGIKEARGRYIAFCDCGDKWMPEKLKRQLKFMSEKGHYFTYTSFKTCNSKGKINGYARCAPKIGRRRIITHNPIGTSTTVYDTLTTGKIYMPSLHQNEDLGLWIDLISRFGAAYGLQEPLAVIRSKSLISKAENRGSFKDKFNVYHKHLKYNNILSVILLAGISMPCSVFDQLKRKTAYLTRRN